MTQAAHLTSPVYLEAVRTGTKRRAVRSRDPVAVGYATFVFENDPIVTLHVEVTRVAPTLLSHLPDDDAVRGGFVTG